MNTLQPKNVWTLVLFAAVSCSLLVGCQKVPNEAKPSEQDSQNIKSADSSPPSLVSENRGVSDQTIKTAATDCGANKEPSSDLMRVRTTREGETIGVTESDTLGFPMRNVFSAPGEWTFIDRPSTRQIVFEGCSKPIERDVLMYYCVDGLHEYPNCGKPESIGSPENYEYKKSIQIYFSYKIDRCNRRFYVSLYDSTSLNSRYAKDFLAYHGFPASDTNIVKMRPMEF